MIDRIAALADIVAPRAVVRPGASTVWPTPAAWWLGAALLVLAGFALPMLLRRLRRGLASRRLRRLATRLRGKAEVVELERLLPGVWVDLRRAGFDMQCLPQPARAHRDRLLYSRRPPAEALQALLEALQP